MRQKIRVLAGLKTEFVLLAAPTGVSSTGHCSQSSQMWSLGPLLLEITGKKEVQERTRAARLVTSKGAEIVAGRIGSGTHLRCFHCFSSPHHFSPVGDLITIFHFAGHWGFFLLCENFIAALKTEAEMCLASTFSPWIFFPSPWFLYLLFCYFFFVSVRVDLRCVLRYVIRFNGIRVLSFFCFPFSSFVLVCSLLFLVFYGCVWRGICVFSMPRTNLFSLQTETLRVWDK